MKILVIQTAFIGDVILATAVVEKLHDCFPEAQIDFLLRKGNESVLENHPLLRNILIWNKKHNKHRHLWQVLKQIRQEKYDYVINLQRYLSTGLLTVLSGAKHTLGFSTNPLSLFFTQRVAHSFDGSHEVERNQKLIASMTDSKASLPRLYPSKIHFEEVSAMVANLQYVCVAPSSVWFTKQYPVHKWIELLQDAAFKNYTIYLLGAKEDETLCRTIQQAMPQTHSVVNLAGRFNLLQSATLIKGARMTFVNDSAPMHLASAMNAPVTAIYCSTVPSFGFGPLSSVSYIVENTRMDCRPCGVHGYKNCPKGHFNCAQQISLNQILKGFNKVLNK